MDRANDINFGDPVGGEDPISSGRLGPEKLIRQPEGARDITEETQWLPPAAQVAIPGDETVFVETPKPGEVPREQSGAARTVFLDARTAEPSYAWLVLVDSPSGDASIGKPISLKVGGTTSIGRVVGNDIVVSDRACSAQHARIRDEWDESDKQAFVIYDLVSANGLYIGTRDNYRDDTSRVYRHILRDGDYILLGGTSFVFKQV